MEGILHGCSAFMAVPYHEAAVAWLLYSVKERFLRANKAMKLVQSDIRS